MTEASDRTAPLAPQYRGRPRTGEIVAGLVNDGSADAVARTAVAHATARRTRVRFVQVVAGDPHAEDASDADARTFEAALHALARQSRVRCTFEVVSGDPVEVLVERSTTASVLVVGRDREDGQTPIAARCLVAARCPVDVVPWRGSGP